MFFQAEFHTWFQPYICTEDSFAFFTSFPESLYSSLLLLQRNWIAVSLIGYDPIGSFHWEKRGCFCLCLFANLCRGRCYSILVTCKWNPSGNSIAWRWWNSLWVCNKTKKAEKNTKDLNKKGSEAKNKEKTKLEDPQGEKNFKRETVSPKHGFFPLVSLPYFLTALISSFFLILSQVWVPLKRSERAWERHERDREA